jgi:hypothetical protein
VQVEIQLQPPLATASSNVACTRSNIVRPSATSQPPALGTAGSSRLDGNCAILVESAGRQRWRASAAGAGRQSICLSVCQTWRCQASNRRRRASTTGARSSVGAA